ncbi:terminase small subunit [Sphingobacterium sp. UT-1RO-CII-1]|uniref:terminase small subunit n=1 Tax=Sphingobacterium sp. UT-1RO-CII-1 TaxID=2995225 RepID=UPI00227B6D76|nr:terminase small subunit [Sphingobacterium sp. UT-1RO-CII-1]
MSDEIVEKARLTAKQQLFLDDYLIHFNATRAAKNAGYSEKTAYSQGQRLLKHVEISSHIEARLKESRMNSDEVMKMMKDIAGSNMNEYMTVVQRERRKFVPKSLNVLIERKNLEIKKHVMYIERKGLDGEVYDGYVEKNIFPLEDAILRAEIDLELDPLATFEDSEVESYESIELDLVKLAKDKEAGKVKSFELTKFGPKVELYPVDGMLDKLARVNGMYSDTLIVDDKNKIDPDKLDDDTLRKLLGAVKREE